MINSCGSYQNAATVLNFAIQHPQLGFTKAATTSLYALVGKSQKKWRRLLMAFEEHTKRKDSNELNCKE
jgi:hypothetical protein